MEIEVEGCVVKVPEELKGESYLEKLGFSNSEIRRIRRKYGHAYGEVDVSTMIDMLKVGRELISEIRDFYETDGREFWMGEEVGKHVYLDCCFRNEWGDELNLNPFFKELTVGKFIKEAKIEETSSLIKAFCGLPWGGNMFCTYKGYLIRGFDPLTFLTLNDILRDMVYIIHDFRENLIDFENLYDRDCLGGAVKDLLISNRNKE
jgi:hypothetical protein